ncbi:Ig-like domain-containing protein, partial [Chloroflexota bacterium]
MRIRSAINLRNEVRLSLIVIAILLWTTVGVLAFTRQWRDNFSGGMGGWDQYLIGNCGGQNHYTSGGQLHMRASYGTDCFGAYYRENNGHPGTFPTTEDVRVMWRWRYLDYELYGTQAGQLTGRYGWPQYYGMSGVNTGGSTNDAHVLSEGPWGTNTVNNPLWRSRTTSWHVSTFDWLCDGVNMRWYMDGSLINQENNSAYYFPPGHESRPYQFWMGNLLADVPSNGNWTPFDVDYVYIYAVQRPQMNTPTPGSAGTQTVSWNTVPNTTQPDGSTWSIQYQVRACNNASCSNVQSTSPWQSGTSYTFTGLPLQRTYTYQARARWVGTPELITCWGNSVSAEMSGEPELSLSKTATPQQDPGDVVQYSLTLANTGDAPAYGVVIRDPIPGYISNPANITGGGSVAGNEVRWNIGTLNHGASVTVRWQGTINLNIPRSVSRITNVATATDNAGHSDTAQAATTILLPDMTLSKSATSPVWPGAGIDFTIGVQSSGQGTLRYVIITDPIPPYVVNPRNISDGGSVVGNNIVWNLGNMNPGATNSLTWRGTIDQTSIPSSQTQIVNTVNGVASTGVNKTAQSSSQVIFPHMTLAKYGPATMWPTGSYGSFVYTMTVANDGAAIMVNPVITDPFPHAYMIDVTNINHGGTITGNAIAGNGITWHLSDMDPGDSVELSYEFGISPLLPESVTEQTNIIYGTADWWEIDERAQHVAQLGRPNLRLTKIAPATTWPNAPISYTILVENTGNAPMYGVVITDAIPHYVTNLSGISHNGQIEGDHIIWHLPDPIPENGRVVLTWHGLIDANIPQYETRIINQVQGRAMITQDSTEAGSVLVYPTMLLDKSAPSRSSPGESIEFVITVQNTGQAPMYDVRINDPIPDYVTNPDAPTGNIIGNNVVWEFPEMAPGETQSLIWSGTIDDNIPDDITTLVNKVYGTAMSGISEYAETTTVMLYPTMNLGKWATPEVWPGSLIEYRITVQNTGAADMEAVEIRDFIPDYVLNVTNISHGGTIDGKEIVWDLGDMAPGASFELTWAGTVDPFIPKSRNLIRNQVQGQAARGVSDVAEATSLVLFPSLVINKTGTEEAAPGDTVQFMIEVHNASAAPVEDVVVKDFIPDHINDPANISYNGYVEGQEIIWEIGSLVGGESFALTWEGTIDLAVPLGQKYLDNLAEICDGLERYCDNALYRLRLLQAEARVIKNATPYGWPGSDVTYTIQILNTGETELQEVIVTDPLPEYIQYPRQISHGGTAVESPFEGEIAVVWPLGDLAIGELVELSWQGTVAKDTPVKVDAIENIATLTTKRGLERQGIGSTYIMHPALRLLKRASEAAGPGDRIDYAITLENPSWIPAYEVEVHDIIPTYILTPTNVSGGGEIWADEIYWHFETVAPGQVITLTWAGTVDPEIPAEEEEIRNTVRAADMTGVEAEAEAVTDLVRQDIVVRKSATYAVQPGHDVAYTIEVENRSGAEISGITVRDAIPAYVLDPRHISGGGEVRGNTDIVWEIASLAAGEILSFAWTGTVDPAIPVDEAVIWNEVTVSSESGLEASTRARSFVDQPLLSVDKIATLNAGPDEAITYTIVVANLGRGPTYDVEVHDPLPAYLHDTVILAGNDGVIQADEVSWLLDGELAAGEVVTLTWSATVDRLVPPDVTEIVNTVNIFDVAGNTSQDQAVTDLLRQQIYLVKDATYLVYPGSSVVYTITLENRGEAVLYDVVVTDPVPEYVLNPANISNGGSNDGNETILWEFAALLPGQVVTMTWTGTVDTNIPLDEQVIWNEATVVTGSGLEAGARARSLVRHPLLTVSKSATNEAGPGDMVDYLVTIKNMGLAPAYGVEVHDPIPAYIVGATSGDATEVRADEVVCGYFDVLPPGAERMLQWSGQVDELIPPDQTRIVNVVTVQDSSGNMDEAEAVTTLRRQAVFIDKTASREVYPGGPVVYTMTLQNRGDTTLYGLMVTDPIPQYVHNPTAISSGGEERGNTHIVWEMPALAIGEVVTMTWSGTVAKDIPATVLSIWNEVKVSTGSGLETMAQARSVVKQPQLVVAKRATNEAGPGEPVDYTLMIANTGQAPAYEVEVMDPIPAYIVSPGGAIDGQIWADQVYWYFDILPPGETRTLTWFGFVDPAVPETELSIVNTATIQDAAGHMDEAEAVTNLPGQAVAVSKDATYLVYPGGDVVYTVTVRNPGAATLYDLTVTDPVPINILNPRDITGGGWLAGNTQIVWEIPALPGGDELVLTWRGTVDRRIPSREQVIWNEVQVVAGSGPAASARAKSWVEHPLLVVEKMATNEAGPGEPVEYAIIVKNTGAGPAYEIEVIDPIPAYITNPGGAAGGQIRADKVYWYLDILQPGESRALSWHGFVDPAIPETELSIVNTVIAQDGAGHTDEARASTNILAQELAVFKNATYMVYPGGDVVYTVTVRNRGTSALYDVLVTDPVPAYVLDPRDITSGGRFDGNTSVIWEIPALAGGQSLDVAWRGTVDPDIPGKEQAIWNQVSVTTAGGLAANAPARSLVRYPSLAVDKSATRQAGPGQTVVYTITVQNLGQSPAHTIEVFDPIPAHIVTPTSADATEIRAEEIYWHLDMLAPGESRTLSWTGLVDPAVPATKAAIVNRVTVQDGSGHTAEAEAITRLPAQAVDVHKDASYLVYPGGDVVYTVTVRNSGAATLYDVTVTDPVPTYILNPRAISDGGHFDGNTAVVWQLAAMAPGESVTLTWTGMVDIEIPAREQSVWNEVSVTTAGSLAAPARARSLVQRPALSVAKSATAAAGPGETVAYTLTIRNPGQAPAYGVEVHDPIPAYILNAASGSATEVRADEVYWQFDTLQPGETHTLTWRGNIDANIPKTIPGIVNKVTVQDAAGQTDEAQAMTNLRLQRVDMVKSGTYTLHPGGDVLYTITVRNPGNTTLYDIVVTDPLPAYVLDPRDITAGGELRGNTEVVWEMATLAAGQEIELAWAGTVDPRIPDKQLSLTNEA